MIPHISISRTQKLSGFCHIGFIWPSVGWGARGSCSIFILKKLFFNVYLFLRERERARVSEQAGEGQRERETESQAGCVLSAQSLTQGLNPETMRSWPEPKPRTGCLTNWATWAPPELQYFKAHLRPSFISFPQILVCITEMCKHFLPWPNRSHYHT